MKIPTSSLLLILSLSLAAIGCSQASSTAGPKRARTAADYTSRTLAEVAVNGSQAVARGEADGNSIVLGEILPSRVRVSNTGNTRQIPASRSDVIRKWAAEYAGSMEHYTLPYQTEYQVLENGIAYWIAVRTQSLPDFQQNFREGEDVVLDLIRLGGAKAGDRWEWVFLVENFSRVD